MSAATGTGASAGISLEVSALRIAFAERGDAMHTILDIPSLAAPGRAHVALCGPSGSGKTTLLDVLAGLRRPRRGRVRWSAIELTALDERALTRWRRATVGFVFQHFHLFPGLTALENVLLPLRLAEWTVGPAMRQRALDLLGRVGVASVARVAVMSRGEQQRVAVARALVRHPPIVLADEPTASLDRDTGRSVADLLCALCRETSATLIVATHDPELAARMDHAYEIADGQLRPRRRGELASIASVV